MADPGGAGRTANLHPAEPDRFPVRRSAMRQTGRSSVVATTARVRVERRGCSEQTVGATARLRLHGKRLPIWLIRAPQASPIRRAAADQVVRRASHNLSAALLKSGNPDRRGALLLGTNSNDFREQHREIRLVTVDYNRLVLVLSP